MSYEELRKAQRREAAKEELRRRSFKRLEEDDRQISRMSDEELKELAYPEAKKKKESPSKVEHGKGVIKVSTIIKVNKDRIKELTPEVEEKKS